MTAKEARWPLLLRLHDLFAVDACRVSDQLIRSRRIEKELIVEFVDVEAMLQAGIVILVTGHVLSKPPAAHFRPIVAPIIELAGHSRLLTPIGPAVCVLAVQGRAIKQVAELVFVQFIAGRTVFGQRRTGDDQKKQPGYKRGSKSMKDGP